ncbi:Uncharacterised protein [Mycobacteroides abscessus subsp. abscessus]|nr:Uncharacterised protein [Mycobacteroides abscessus subsp. abscessus]
MSPTLSTASFTLSLLPANRLFSLSMRPLKSAMSLFSFVWDGATVIRDRGVCWFE